MFVYISSEPHNRSVSNRDLLVVHICQMEFGIFPCIIIIIRYFEDTLGSSYKKYKVNLIFCG